MSTPWYENAVFYQIYPLGFVGAPTSNDASSVDGGSGGGDSATSIGMDGGSNAGVGTEGGNGADDGIRASDGANAGDSTAPILKVVDWIPHLQSLGVGAVYFSPVFESDSHGYDTRDYRKIDRRLGTNDDFKRVVHALHDAGIKVVLDGVFNHVGRGFWAFKDVLQNRESSPYRWWFNISFDGDNGYGDGLWYEGWEGHFELVKLNLQNQDIVNHLLDSVGFWMDEFGIDGLRLDVAYMLDESFMRQLRTYAKSRRDDFLLLGEMIHGDYNRIMNPSMLDSVTNYECYKGLYSAFNSMNLFEIGHSLARQFGPEPWTLYKGAHLLNFADNHDVSRVASILNDKGQLPALYTVLFCMPGMPCVYYGSEWGAEGRKEDGDWGLRLSFDAPEENALTGHIAQLAKARENSWALRHGGFENVNLMNRQWVFKRAGTDEDDRWEEVLVAVNAEGAPFDIDLKYGGPATDLMTGEAVVIEGPLHLGPYESRVLRLS